MTAAFKQDSFGSFLRQLREKKHLSQSELAEQTGALPQPDISRIEHETLVPTTADLRVLTRSLVPKSRQGSVFEKLSALVTESREQRDAAKRRRAALRKRKLQAAKAQYVPVLGPNIRALRESQNLSRKKLADRAGIHQNHLAQIEAGQVRQPGPKTLRRLAKALGVVQAELQAPKVPKVPLAVGPVTQAAAKAHGWVAMPGLYPTDQLVEVYRHLQEREAVALIAARRDENGNALFIVYRGQGVPVRQTA